MRQIIEANEVSYYKRYGISLSEMWNTLSQDEKDKALGLYTRLINTELECGINFEKEHLLRIAVGYGGKEFLKNIRRNAPSLMKIVVWEPQKTIFLAGCASEDIHKFIEDERISICIGREEILLKECLLDNVLVTNAFHNKIIAVGDYTEINNEDVAFFSSCYIKVAEEVLGEGNSMKYFNQLSCENWLNAINILNNNFIIGQLFEQIKTRSIPVIIVAAGPSLKKNCDMLRKAKGKALIISVTHALKTLFCNGIKPDIIAVKDSVHYGFVDCDKDREYMLLSSVYAAKNDQNAYNGKVIFWGFSATAGLFHTRRTELYQEIPCGSGSVATDVFSLFLQAGFRNFILVGQDLAYDDEGFSHSDGKKENSEIVYKTEGLYGNTVRTRSDWEYMRRTYEKKIEEYGNIKVIDATEGGARIKGTVIMTLKDAVEQFCNEKYPISQWLSQLKHGDDEEREQIDRWFEECRNDCETFNKRLDNIIEQNKKILTVWNDTDKWDDNFRALCRRYDIMYNIIMDGESGFILKHYCIKEIQKYIENALVLEGDENIEKRMKLECELFTLMRSMGDRLMDYITELRQ